MLIEPIDSWYVQYSIIWLGQRVCHQEELHTYIHMRNRLVRCGLGGDSGPVVARQNTTVFLLLFDIHA